MTFCARAGRFEFRTLTHTRHAHTRASTFSRARFVRSILRLIFCSHNSHTRVLIAVYSVNCRQLLRAALADADAARVLAIVLRSAGFALLDGQRSICDYWSSSTVDGRRSVVCELVQFACTRRRRRRTTSAFVIGQVSGRKTPAEYISVSINTTTTATTTRATLH